MEAIKYDILNYLNENQDKGIAYEIIINQLGDKYSHSEKILALTMLSEFVYLYEGELWKISPFGIKKFEAEREKRHQEALAVEKAKKEKEMQLEKLSYDLKLSKFYARYRWLPLAISLLAFLVALYSAFIKK